MARRFKIGDVVRISTLDYKGTLLRGKVGHEGTITEITKGMGKKRIITFYRLNPKCIGQSWPKECIELVRAVESSMDDSTPNKVEDLFEKMVKGNSAAIITCQDPESNEI